MTPLSPAVAAALLVFGPLLAAIWAVLQPRAGRIAGLASVGLCAAALLPLVQTVLGSGELRLDLGGWGVPLGIALRVDGPALWLLAVSTAVGGAVTLFSALSPGPPSASPAAARAFWPLLLFLGAALNALFLSADIFNLYVTLELTTFAAVALVALSGTARALAAATRYLLASLAGSLCYLMGVALLYGAHGTVDLALLGFRITPSPQSFVALALLSGGLLLKAGLFPLHFWLPPAHSSAPPPVSALLSALVVKGAFAILLRLWFEAYAGVAPALGQALLGLMGGAAVLFGSVQALRQKRLKLLVAYSTVAQLGYLYLLYPLGQGGLSPAVGGGALLFLAAHAAAKAAMFLAAGNILVAAGHDRIAELDGMVQRLPVSTFAIALAGISLVGLPPSGGFLGKWLLLGAAIQQGQWAVVAVILAGSLLAAAYIMRVLSHAVTRVEPDHGPTGVTRPQEWIALCLGLGAVLLGLLARGPMALVQGAYLFGGGPR